MDKNEYARIEIPQLIRRVRVVAESVKDEAFIAALSKAEKAVGDNDISGAIGYLEQTRTIHTTDSKQKHALIIISEFIKKYDNYEQAVATGALARIESKIDDVIVRLGKIEQRGSTGKPKE